MVVTRRSLGRTSTVWALALSGLLTVAGAGVWARSRYDHTSPRGSVQAPTAQASQGQTNQGQRGGHFDGRGGPQGSDRLAGPPPSPLSVGWEWCKDDEVKKEIGLRSDQANRIDAYYSSRLKDIDSVVKEYQTESAALDKMVSDRLVDVSTLSVEITKYWALRAEVGRSRLLMDYRIARVLDVDQYAKLKAIADRRLKEYEARRGRGGGPAPTPHGSLLR